MNFQGMDTDQVTSQSEALVQAARRLEGVLGELDAGVRAAQWVGPDADAFRERWDGTRREGESRVLAGLEDRADEMRKHVEEQERASRTEDGGFLEGALDWLRDAGEGILDGISDGIDWVGDRIGEGLDWIGDRAQDVGDAIGTAIDAIRDFEWPRLTEVLVDGATGLVRGTGDAIDALFGTDLRWAEDGTGYADPPVAVSAEDSGLVPPSDLSQIIANTNTTYGDKETGGVSMSVVGNPPTGVIVNIPGTEQWGPSAGDNPMDLTGNAAQAGSGGWSAGSEATADAIAQLYEAYDIPPGTPLMLNGHSQGGMIASSLAQNEEFASQYNLTHVMTYGSPVENYSVPDSVSQLNIQHRGDLVPMIDADGMALVGPGGGSPTATTVTLDSPSWWNPMTNHSGSEYQNSVQTQLQDPDSALSQYSQDPGLQVFLTGDPEGVQHYTSGVHRQSEQ